MRPVGRRERCFARVRRHQARVTQRVQDAPLVRARLRERLERETAARRRAERKLRLLEGALQITQIGVTITDTDGRIVYTNPADATMHGWQPGELLDQDVGAFSPPDDRRPLGLDELRNVGSWARESVNVRRDGSAFSVRLLSDVVRDAEGEPIGLVTTCEDITRRKHD